MSAKHTIVINGKLYDAVTGMPVDKPATPAVPRPAAGATMDIARPVSVPRAPGHSSKSVHRTTAHSTTLRRSHLTAPESTVPTSAPKHHVAGHTGRSPMIAHFAPHPQPLPKKAHNIIDAAPTHAPAAPHAVHHAPRPSSQQVKEQLIARASQNVTAVQHAAEQTHKQKRSRKPLRRSHIVSAAVALVLLGGYLSYVSMPGLSVSMAGSQAGVAAKYPNYSPDGYSFEGPVAFQPGQVSLNFKSNGGGNGYVIEQRASTWNSVALLDNFVESASKGNYETTAQNGVTIYTYGNNAAWTNGGVFYSITGEAPLDTEQLLHIAASM